MQNLRRRFGCGAFLIVWFVLIMLPCPIFVLAIQREVTVKWSDIPQDELRIWLIQQPKLRGVAWSNARRVTVENVSSALAPTGKATCTIIDSSFFLWEGKADAAHQCSCYVQQDQTWRSIAEGPAACQLAGETR